MAASPKWKVYDSAGAYQAACKDPAAAGAVVGLYGKGSTIRLDHGPVVWREGEDGWAGESLDMVAVACFNREETLARAAYDKVHGPGAAERVIARAMALRGAK